MVNFISRKIKWHHCWFSLSTWKALFIYQHFVFFFLYDLFFKGLRIINNHQFIITFLSLILINWLWKVVCLVIAKTNWMSFDWMLIWDLLLFIFVPFHNFVIVILIFLDHCVFTTSYSLLLVASNFAHGNGAKLFLVAMSATAICVVLSLISTRSLLSTEIKATAQTKCFTRGLLKSSCCPFSLLHVCRTQTAHLDFLVWFISCTLPTRVFGTRILYHSWLGISLYLVDINAQTCGSWKILVQIEGISGRIEDILLVALIIFVNCVILNMVVRIFVLCFIKV